jgi:hypothetical protein
MTVIKFANEQFRHLHAQNYISSAGHRDSAKININSSCELTIPGGTIPGGIIPGGGGGGGGLSINYVEKGEHEM